MADPEPLLADDPLWRCLNVLISPRFAGGGRHAGTERIAPGVVDNLEKLLAGLPLANVAGP